MSRVFVDTSAWYALAAPDDVSHDLAVRLLGQHQGRLVTTDHVLVETWAVARSRRHRAAADELVAAIVDRSVAELLTATPQDIVTALRIGETFADQDFSMIDRTSWAVMERCGITEAVVFDIDFAVYRFGPHLDQAITIHR